MSEINGSPFPVLRYRDANAAIDWLCQVLGAREHQVHRDDAGAVQHAELEIAGGLIMLGEAREDGRMGGEGFSPLSSPSSIYAVVDDPDALYERAKSGGATIVRELTDEPYGSREFSIRDLEGNLWSFGTYDPASPRG